MRGRESRPEEEEMYSAVVVVVLLAISSFSSEAITDGTLPTRNTTTTSTCPMDLSYVQRLPWDYSPCNSMATETTSTTKKNQNQTKICCQTLLSLFGIGLALHLKETSLFHLSDLSTAVSCVSDFQSKLSSLSLPPSLASTCFGDPSRFVVSPTTCAGILTKQDWLRRLGGDSTPSLSPCSSNLSDLTLCNACVSAGFEVSSKLTSIDGNASHATNCFYFTVLYAAGVVNEMGPENPISSACILGLAFFPPPDRDKGRDSHSALIFALTGAGVAVVLISSLAGMYLWWARRRKKERTATRLGLAPEEDEQSPKPRFRPNTGSIWFSIKELEKATDNFSQKNLIGRGGFGIVYKGTLSNGTSVAVKKIIESDFRGDAEFRNEVEIISNLKHRNLVPLIGCCVTDEGGGEDEEEGRGGGGGNEWYLVYEYMINGNLENHIFCSSGSRKRPLSWPQRKSIVLDVAKGIAYLHYGVKPAIYHRDIKATNILLDGDMKARVADFGLAKQSTEGQSHLTTRVAGTHGYLAPEYALYGQLTGKSDVYSFGVVVLEMMSGRKALDLSSTGSPRAFLITDWAWTLVRAGRIEEVLEESLRGDGGDGQSRNPKEVMERFVLVGILCAHVMVALRPTILDALKMLEGDMEVPPIPDRPLPLGHRSSLSMDGNLFSQSPSLSGFLLHSRDMLR